jgi:hypothetical protein
VVNIPGTAQKLASDYTQLGAYIGLTAGPPGTGSSPANEPSGSGYARQKTTWGPPNSSGTCTGTQVTIDVPQGNYDHMIVMDAATGGNFIDWCPIPGVNIMTGPGKILVTPVYTQS